MSYCIRTRRFPSPSVLGEIVANTSQEVANRASPAELQRLRLAAQPTERSYIEALSRDGLALIAEVKRKAPSSGMLRPDLEPATIAEVYGQFADAISVVTDRKYFGGSLELLTEIRGHVACPVMLKDFVVSEYQILEARVAGADTALLMSSVLPPDSLEHLLGCCRKLGMEPLVECYEAEDIQVAQECGARIIGINNRNLHTLEVSGDRFHRLAPTVDRSNLRVAESGSKTQSDLERLRKDRCADAVLIGSALMSSSNLEAKLRELGFSSKAES